MCLQAMSCRGSIRTSHHDACQTPYKGFCIRERYLVLLVDRHPWIPKEKRKKIVKKYKINEIIDKQRKNRKKVLEVSLF